MLPLLRRGALPLLIAAGPLLGSASALRLASPFGDHMVLQEAMPVPVWGTAAAGDTVTVRFAGQALSAAADAQGRWSVRLAPVTAGGPYELTAEDGADRVAFSDVLVGEVWLASGQSNMEFSVSKKVKYFAGVANEAQEIAAANYPRIRMFTGKMATSYQPRDSIAGSWQVCSPQTVPAFSAVGYFFARQLQRTLNVPIGIINESYGASTAEAWVSRQGLAADPQLQPMLERFDALYRRFDAHRPTEEEKAQARRQYLAEAAAARAAGKRPPRPPRNPDPSQDQHSPTVLFNAMIQPIVPYAIRGVIWYQGESIVGGARGIAEYPRVQAALVEDWRRRWGEGDFPFDIVQLAGQDASSNSPEVRQAQATILRLPNTGMAVTIDIGERHNVHPKDKQDVGERLALIALAQTYGRDVEYAGPTFAGASAENGSIRISFTHAASGLVARVGPLKTFEVAGADGVFVPAQAEIQGRSVVASSPQVPSPRSVRYAWSNYPEGCNLYNGAGLPAAPFQAEATGTP